MKFSVLLMCAAEVAVLRDGPAEVSGGSTIDAEHAVPPEDLVVDKAGPGAPRVRTHGSWQAADLTKAVLEQALFDPFSMACLLLLGAYVLMHHMLPKESLKVVETRRDSDAMSAVSGVSSTSGKSRRSRAPDRFALVVNQKLTKLDTVDEVLDFALASTESGRTDIVNIVTAIHRSAKLVAAQPKQRVKLGQDPRMRALLDHLLTFLAQGGHSASIVSRAVGNTSWALAKVQFRQDPLKPHAILETLQGLFVQHATDFRPEELMNTVWAFGELRRDKDSPDSEARALAVAEATCRCIDKFDDFTLQQVVYFAWALARLSSISSVKLDSSEVRKGLLQFTAKIVGRVANELASLNPKNLAMLSWAVACLHSNMELTAEESSIDTLLLDITQLVPKMQMRAFQPGELASILWAVNKVKVDAPGFYIALREHLIAKGLSGFNPQDISTIVCAFVKTGHGTDALYEELRLKAMSSSKDFSRSEKMMVSWAFSQLPNVTPPEL